MILLGDTVFPYSDLDSELLTNVSESFLKSPKMVNMEAAIRQNNIRKLASGVGLLSDPAVLEFYKKLNVCAVSLSNNHITDFDITFSSFTDTLHMNGIFSFGAGVNAIDASIPYVNHELKVVVLAFGWNVITCKYAKKARTGVNPYEYTWVEENVIRFRKQYSNYKLVVSLHCNYEFEKYPQPADRQFAFHLVDIGVDLIVCHHPHIIQGFENYKGINIFYSLGNFYFPNGEYNGSHVAFPPESNVGLGIDVTADDAVYVTKLAKNKLLQVGDAKPANAVLELKGISDFSELKHHEYISYFKENRAKRKLLPIYSHYKNTKMNWLYDMYVMNRQRPVDMLGHLKSKLRKL